MKEGNYISELEENIHILAFKEVIPRCAVSVPTLLSPVSFSAARHIFQRIPKAENHPKPRSSRLFHIDH